MTLTSTTVLLTIPFLLLFTATRMFLLSCIISWSLWPWDATGYALRVVFHQCGHRSMSPQ